MDASPFDGCISPTLWCRHRDSVPQSLKAGEIINFKIKLRKYLQGKKQFQYFEMKLSKGQPNFWGSVRDASNLGLPCPEQAATAPESRYSLSPASPRPSWLHPALAQPYHLPQHTAHSLVRTSQQNLTSF